MATRARIGIEQPDGTVRSVYSHWDGYPTGVGQTLLDHYSTVAKLSTLLDEGDVSSLGSEIGEMHPFDAPMHERHEDHQGWTLFYGRDRGEDGIEAKTHGRDDWPDYGQEYEYFLRPDPTGSRGDWYCRDIYGDKVWQPLSFVIGGGLRPSSRQPSTGGTMQKPQHDRCDTCGRNPHKVALHVRVYLAFRPSNNFKVVGKCPSCFADLFKPRPWDSNKTDMERYIEDGATLVYDRRGAAQRKKFPVPPEMVA